MRSQSDKCGGVVKRSCQFIAAAILLAGPALAAADTTTVTPSTTTSSARAPFTLMQTTDQPMATSISTGESAPQTSTHQLNQLLQFETTPDMCAAGQGYVTGGFNFYSGIVGAGPTTSRYAFGQPVVQYQRSGDQYRYQLQGQYGVTNDVAVGAFIPIVSDSGQSTGMGDVGVYAQFKLDRFIDPNLINLTAQCDVILPTGSTSEFRDSGRLGIRPLIVAYKNFGYKGPGILGAYGLLGFTVQKNSDVRINLAATYEYEHFVGVMEFSDIDGSGDGGQSLVLFTPGVIYRGFKSFEVAVGIPIGMDHSSPDWGVTCKITYAFAK